MHMRNLVIIEDDKDVRRVLTDSFNEEPGFRVVYSCASFEDFVHNWDDELLDIVLCDIGLPGKSGIEATWYIKGRSPQTHVLILTVFDEKEKIFQSLCAGASGYMLKGTPLSGIRAGVQEILEGGAAMSPRIARQVLGFFSRQPQQSRGVPPSKLTTREIEVLSYLEQGLSNKEISESLHVTLETIKYHIRNIYLKLQVGSRSELFATYRNHSRGNT